MNTARIVAVCLSDAKGTPKRPCDSALLVADHGLAGDAHAGPGHRQVSLLPLERINEFQAAGAEVAFGDFGENLVVTGIDFAGLAVGDRLRVGTAGALLEITQFGKTCHAPCRIHAAMGDCIMPRHGVFARVVVGGEVAPGCAVAIERAKPAEAGAGKKILTAAVVVVSDRAARGERADGVEPVVREKMAELGIAITETHIVADDKETISKLLIELCGAAAPAARPALVLTSGGTGFAPRDVTPEATLAVIESLVPGIPEAMRAASLQKTSRAILSRATAGIRGGTLIVNLPGSPTAVRECLDAVADALPHGLAILRGTEGDCARPGPATPSSSASAAPDMATIPVTAAAGTVLCHDITRIVPGEYKGPAFRKGHVVTDADIPELLKLGKENLYVWRPQAGMLHENDAALRLARAAAGPGLTLTEPVEGKINFTATGQGLLSVNARLLDAVNGLGQIALATKHSNREVAAGEPVAGVRVIPLIVREELVLRAEELCRAASSAGEAPIVSVLPFRPFRVGVIVTGSEVYHGRIKDGFGPVLREKFARLGSTIMGERMTSDDVDLARAAILAFIDDGADMVALTGGMSVDPDDRTPAAIRAAGAQVIAYGAPVFPGAMFMLARAPSPRGPVPVLGLPGCVMYHRASIFDLIVPRILAGLDVTAADIARLGHGGFCANCPDCRFPNCPFGI